MTINSFYKEVLPVLTLSLAALVVCGFFSWEGLHSLHLRWIRFDEPYAIGYPAIVLAAWWILRHWQFFSSQPMAPASSAFLLFATALVGIAVGRLVQLQLLQQLGAICMLWAGVTAILGWRVGRLLLFPLMLVTLVIPVWDFLIDPLRAMTVWFNQHMLDWLRIPAYIDGYLIRLPSGSLEVAGGCSGLNLLLAMTCVGLLFAESHQLLLAHRVAIVVLAMAIGILDNWIRVFVLVLLAHSSQMQSELLHNHGSLGWWIFAASLLPYFLLASRIEANAPDLKVSAPITQQSSAAAPRREWRQMTATALMLVVATVAIGVGASLFEHRRGSATSGFAGPAGAAAITPSWMPSYRGQDVVQSWKMNIAGRNVELTALTFVEQRSDKKMIYYSNVIAAERSLRSGEQIAIAPGFAVNAAIVKTKSARVVWWYWWVDGAVATSPLKTKLLQLRAMLLGDPSAAVIALSIPCGAEDCASLMREFTPLIKPLLIESRQMPLAR
jgi:EpsI family protein